MTDQPAALDVPHQDAVTDVETEHAYVAAQYDREVQRVARDLHDLADRILRHGSPAADQQDPGFGQQAAALVSDVSNAVPNLGLGALIRAAAEADTTLLSRRLQRAVHENDTLRANQHLPVAPVGPAASGSPDVE